MNLLKRLSIAIRFLTILPLPDNGNASLKDIGRAAALFPAVGALIGLILFGCYAVLNRVFSPLLTAVLIGCAWAWITGLLHLDGLVDTADGLSAGADKEKILAVMKDPHCGAKGVVVLVFFILLKVALVYELFRTGAWPALVWVPMTSRWGMTGLMIFCRSAKPQGMGAGFIHQIRLKEFLVASVLTGLIGVCVTGMVFAFYMAVVLGVVFLLKNYWHRKLNGITGDVLGASTELLEVCCLVLVCLWNKVGL